jgi:hypothetical protein
VEVETVGRYRYRLSLGWNLVGGLDQVVGIDRMKVRPSGSVYSGVYGYDSQSGCYVQVEELLPGRGYWIEAQSSCELIVNTRGRSLSKGLSCFSGAGASGHKPPALPGFVAIGRGSPFFVRWCRPYVVGQGELNYLQNADHRLCQIDGSLFRIGHQ